MEETIQGRKLFGEIRYADFEPFDTAIVFGFGLFI